MTLWTAKNYITPQDLAGLPLIGVKRQPVRGEIANWLGVDLLRQVKTFAFSNLPANAAMMVQEGLGYALVVEGIFAFWDKRAIACRPLKPEITATSILAWKSICPMPSPPLNLRILPMNILKTANNTSPLNAQNPVHLNVQGCFLFYLRSM